MRLGEKFHKIRTERHLEVDTVSRMTRIPPKYLEAIESGSFCSLPKARSHRTAYIRELARILEISPEECLEQFDKEAGFKDAPITHPHQGIRMFPFASISIFVRNIAIGALVVSFAGYLIWQVKGILEPPYLTIFSPSEGYIVSTPKATVEGETEKESRLTVNGQEVMVSEQGKFSTQIDLGAGVNTIDISATKKHGKTTTITRHIVVKLPTQPVTLK
jgi:cytoskeletal protein RodZ